MHKRVPSILKYGEGEGRLWGEERGREKGRERKREGVFVFKCGVVFGKLKIF